VPSPFDCWLGLRGIRTLGVRLGAACDSAAKVAEFLANDQRVGAVHYPGLRSHPEFDLAQRQFNSGGGMISYQVKAGAEAARAMCSRTKVFTCATSLGGVESLIEHRATVEGKVTTTPADLIRLSIGLEHPEDLIADLAHALG
jgi:cystathionine gamma-synthase